ncbi:MAG: D-hexose-6-phosphate mutarotase [Pseudomonadota bacterium]
MPSYIIEERPGLPELILEHAGARVRLSLQGAHITEYFVNDENLFWVSDSARFSPGAAIRGGIPLCWPWFGASLDDPEWPQHGFARKSQFEPVSQDSNAEFTSAVLQLTRISTVPEWEAAAQLEFEVRLSDRLWMQMRTTNCSNRDLLVGCALHSYFEVSDCGAVSIPALTGLDYLDKTKDFARKTQATPMKVEGEVDRVFLEPPSCVELVDPGYERTLSIEAWGHSDLVVWNPGPKVAASMNDFDDDGFRQMICIEPALALNNRKRLAPGESFCVGQTLRCVHQVPRLT